MSEDLYGLLGVPRDSTEDEIRSAYRKLAHKYHPDKTGGDKKAEDQLKRINAAYDVLKNKEKRAQYDRYGEAGVNMGGGGPGQGFGAGSPFEDIFDAFFGGSGGGGGGARASRATRGDDLEYRLVISLREAASGIKKTINFGRMENCSDCSGTGEAHGSTKEVCYQCKGAGQVRMAQGFFSVTRTCPHCSGRGSIIKNPCKRCRGDKMVETERELSVDVPAGVDRGSKLRISGEGEPGQNGGPRGDLYIVLDVKEDELFIREGNHIVCEFPLGFAQAILGATVVVPTLEGEAELKIPAGTQSGTLFKLRGMGIPDVRGYHKGDQLVRVQVETPTKLNRDQRELIQRFDELSTAKTYPIHRKFLTRLKSTLKM